MAYKLQNNPGVTVYSSPEEAKAAGAIDRVEQGADGNLYATPHQGWLLRNMPWLVMGTMAAGAGAAAAGAGAGASGGAAGAASAPVGGLLPATHLPVGALMGGPAAIASQGASGGLGALLGKVGSGISHGLSSLLTSKDGIGSLASIIPALMAAKGVGSGSGTSGIDNDFLKNAYAESQRVNDLKETRFRRVDPLHQAVTQLAFNRMPDSARQGLSINPLDLPAGRQ